MPDVYVCGSAIDADVLILDGDAVFAGLRERGDVDAGEMVAVVDPGVDDRLAQILEGELVVDARAEEELHGVGAVEGDAAVREVAADVAAVGDEAPAREVLVDRFAEVEVRARRRRRTRGGAWRRARTDRRDRAASAGS